MTAPAPPSRAARWVVPAACAALLVVHAVAFFGPYVNDDAFITFRYSRALASGQGPYFNEGEHVEGYTNFLLMLLVAFAIKLAGAAAAAPFAKGVGLVSGAAAVVLAFALARRLSPSHPLSAGGCAAGLVASSPAFALNTESGLETALFSALLAAGVFTGLARAGRRFSGAGLLFALAALTRPEGALVFGLWFAGALLEAALRRDGRRARLKALALDALLVALTVAGHLLFRHATYDGEWLPNTYWAKSAGFAGISRLSYVLRGAMTPLLGVVGAVAAVAGWSLVPERGRALPVATAAIGGACLPFLSGVDWMLGYRLVVPYLPLLAALAGVGFCALLSRLPRSDLVPVFAAMIVLAAFGVQSSEREDFAAHVATRARGYREGHAQVAALLKTVVPPGGSVAIVDIGIVGFENPQLTVIDLSGLTDRFIARSPGEFLDKRYDPAYVLDRRPDAIVLGLTRNARGLLPWTREDELVLKSPGFRAAYVDRARTAASDDDLERLAASLGALRIYAHAYPGKPYYLAVFRRQPGA